MKPIKHTSASLSLHFSSSTLHLFPLLCITARHRSPSASPSSLFLNHPLLSSSSLACNGDLPLSFFSAAATHLWVVWWFAHYNSPTICSQQPPSTILCRSQSPMTTICWPTTTMHLWVGFMGLGAILLIYAHQRVLISMFGVLILIFGFGAVDF